MEKVKLIKQKVCCVVLANYFYQCAKLGSSSERAVIIGKPLLDTVKRVLRSP